MPLETFFTPSEQTILFFYSIILGASLGAVFDIFRSFRALIPHKSVFVMLEDILFVLLWGASLLVFSVELVRGEVRLYCFFGSGIGFVLYVLTIGKFTLGIVRGISAALRIVLRSIFRMFVLPVKRFFVALYQMLKPVFVNVYLKLKKPSQIPKNSLKKHNGVVYNKPRNLRPSGDEKKGRKRHRPKKRKSSGKGCEQIEKSN